MTEEKTKTQSNQFPGKKRRLFSRFYKKYAFISVFIFIAWNVIIFLFIFVFNFIDKNEFIFMN